MNTIHYGILSNEEQPSISIPAGFRTDKDSFLEWGEKQDHTLHVVSFTVLNPSETDYITPEHAALKLRIDDDRERLNALLKEGQRLVDYVIVTDFDDWAEHQHTWLMDGSMS